MITKITALLSIRPDAQWSWDGEDYSDLEWLDLLQTKPTEIEIINEFNKLKLAEPKQNCKNQAKQLIALSDWSVLPDVNITNKSEFENYRTQLRNLIINPVENPIFPTEPNPIWITFKAIGDNNG
jgi:hypothetical protein